MQAGAVLTSGVLAAAVAVTVTGCDSRVLDLQVELVTQTCQPANDPLDGAVQLRFTVFGENVDSVRHRRRIRLDEGQREISLPEIPVGRGRNLVVEALGPADRLIARGETGPVEFLGADPLMLRLALRRADSFSPTNDLAEPGACTGMQGPRAGHTATVLEDGRVLLAGGFHLDANGLPIYDTLTEVYDPRTGLFSEGPRLSVPRAYHSAHHFPGTPYTLLVGGQYEGQNGRAIKVAELYDEQTAKFRAVAMLEGRSRHAAVIDASGGRLLVAGGFDKDGNALASTEIFDVARGTFAPGPVLAHGRGEMGVVALSPSPALPQGAVLLAGGWDGAAPVTTIDLMVPRPNAPTFDLRDSEMELPRARTLPLLAPLSQANSDPVVLAAGGRTGRDVAQPNRDAVQWVDRIDLSSRSAVESTSMQEARANGFAVTLADGTVLLGGGATADQTGQSLPLGGTEIAYLADSQGGIAIRQAGEMGAARFLAASALLNDGTVLVTGGLGAEAGGSRLVALSSAEIFQPIYHPSAEDPYR